MYVWFPCAADPVWGRMLSDYRCMRGCLVAHTVVCMGKLVFTMDVGPSTHWSLLFSRRLVCEGTICMCCDVPNFLVYNESPL